MVRTQIQLTDQQSERLRLLAARENVSLAEIVRRAVDEMARSAAPSRSERRRRALEAAGRFSSGRRDTSRRHDAALVEAFGSR